MNDDRKPLVTAAELEALIEDWGHPHPKSVDRFFPIRFWFLITIASAYALMLLFWTDFAVNRVANNPVDAIRIGYYMYFRGWLIIGIVSLGCYSYFKNWYPAIIFSTLFILSCMNFVSDLFNIYASVIAKPTPIVTLALIARLISIWFLYLCVKNSSRIPNVQDRMNIMILFRKDV